MELRRMALVSASIATVLAVVGGLYEAQARLCGLTRCDPSFSRHLFLVPALVAFAIAVVLEAVDAYTDLRSGRTPGI
jgi:hypothetical protein